MPRYRKKPVIIEAMQWDGSEESAAQIRTMLSEDVSYEVTNEGFFVKLYISTREGELNASIGDWIVKGIKNEVYPVKDDIFNLSYDPLEDEQ